MKQGWFNDYCLKLNAIFFCIVCTFLFAGIITVKAQKVSKVEIINADSFEFDEALGNGAKRLIGHVMFRQENVLMQSDSAYFFSNNTFDAFGHIHIAQSDSMHMYGDLLKYNGNTKTARLTGKQVLMKDKEMTLTTTLIDMNTASNIASYNTGGKITSKSNVLTSNIGYYYGNDKNLFFKGNVVLINPEYTMTCDSLKYHTKTETAFFTGPSHIKSANNHIYCENGWYDTKADKARFSKHAWLKNKGQQISGDSLFYDAGKGIGTAMNHVEVYDSANKVSIKGNRLDYDEIVDKTVVTDHAVMVQYFSNDTLYLHADTLKATFDSTYFAIKKIKDEEANPRSRNKKDKKKNVKVQMPDSLASGHRIILAYHKVKFFKRDLQGVCDSLAYTSSDSLMYLYRNPVLWSDSNQLTAEHMNIKLYNGEIYRLDMRNNCFIISQYDSVRFNQIKGRNMTGFFTKNELRKIDVKGNGETIYYVKDNDESLTGVNKAACSDLSVYVEHEKVVKLVMYKEPSGVMHPPASVIPAEMRLKDFIWYEGYKPSQPDDIFTWKNFPEKTIKKGKKKR